MTENQTGRLVDSGAGTFGLQINDEARKAFIDGRDGTPEFILMCMRRLLNRDMTQVTGDIAKEIAKDNFTEAWDNTKRYIQAQQPDTEYIFEALATFHSAKITPTTFLVLQYASYIMRKGKTKKIIWQRMNKLKRALSYLETSTSQTWTVQSPTKILQWKA